MLPMTVEKDSVGDIRGNLKACFVVVVVVVVVVCQGPVDECRVLRKRESEGED